MNSSVLAVMALLTGALIPLQLAFNGQLGLALRSPFLGALGVFVVGVVALVLLLAVIRSPLPTLSDLGGVPATAWLGGLIAMAYIVAVVFLVPRLGVGTTAVLVIAGQLVAAMVLDHLGAFGAAQSSLTWTKALGGASVLAGAAIVKLG